GGYVPTTSLVATPTVAALDTTVKNFAFQRTGVIRGSVFSDANHNGIRDTAEAGVPGFRIYLDLNGNGHFDAKKDLWVRTDTSGDFEFDNLRTGSYRLRITEVASWVLTTPKSFSTAVAPGGSSSKRFGVRRIG